MGAASRLASAPDDGASNGYDGKNDVLCLVYE